MTKTLFILPLALVLLSSTLFAQEVPVVGRKAAARYLGTDKVPSEPTVSRGPGEHVLALSVGSFIGSKSYQWKGSTSRENVGRASYGVTYLLDEWHGLDLNIRLDFNEYKLDDNRAVKLSFMPLISFPRAESGFPLYFGVGGGLGVFFQQIPEESNLAFDYQLVAGARFLNLFENAGFFFEMGLKNHLHLLSDGQLNGTALTTGAVFSF